MRIGHRKHIKISDTVLCVGKRKIEIFDISGKSTGNISGIRDAAQEGSDLRLFLRQKAIASRVSGHPWKKRVGNAAKGEIIYEYRCFFGEIMLQYV